MRPTRTELVDGTLRRPAHERSAFVAELLAYLRRVGFEAAPRELGHDDRGRQVFEWIPGDVPDASPFHLEQDQQREAALLIRRFHDAASSFPGAGGAETVEHGDLGPHNTVFRRGRPVAIIDWDSSAVPGTRARDFAQAVWGFTDLLEDRVDLATQRAGLRVMCSAYGDITAEVVLDELQARFIRARADHRAHGRQRAVQAFDDVLLRLDRDQTDLLGGR